MEPGFESERGRHRAGRKRETTVWAASQKPLILVVDDGLDARDLYTQYLGFHGFQVIEAKDGEQPVRLATEAMPASS